MNPFFESELGTIVPFTIVDYIHHYDLQSPTKSVNIMLKRAYQGNHIIGNFNFKNAQDKQKQLGDYKTFLRNQSNIKEL